MVAHLDRGSGTWVMAFLGACLQSIRLRSAGRKTEAGTVVGFCSGAAAGGANWGRAGWAQGKTCGGDPGLAGAAPGDACDALGLAGFCCAMAEPATMIRATAASARPGLTQSTISMFLRRGRGVMTPRPDRSKSKASGPLLLVLIVDLLEVGVDDVVLGLGRFAALGLAALSRGLRRLVHGFPKLHGGLHQVGRTRLDDLGVLTGERLTERVHGGFDALAIGFGNLVAVLLDRFLGGVDE